MKIGAAETRMPASWDSMWFSPKVMSRNGIDDLDEARSRPPTASARAAARARPSAAASASRTTAPSAVRMQTIAPSLKSSSATLMNMYEAPHTAAAPPIISQERRVIATRASQRRSHQRQQTSLGQDISCADASSLASR